MKGENTGTLNGDNIHYGDTILNSMACNCN